MLMSESFDLGELPQPASGQAYRVLARKYRPQRFSELIGQDAMVTTLGNAIKRDRIAHAFLMTGVRGVGKTSTARLIAKALNCIGPDGQGGPTIDPSRGATFSGQYNIHSFGAVALRLRLFVAACLKDADVRIF